MKKMLIFAILVSLVIALGYVVVKCITCPIPKFSDQEIEFIQNEEGLK